MAKDVLLEVTQKAVVPFLEAVREAADPAQRQAAVSRFTELLVPLKQRYEMPDNVFAGYVDACLGQSMFLDPDLWVADRLESIHELPDADQPSYFQYGVRRLRDLTA